MLVHKIGSNGKSVNEDSTLLAIKKNYASIWCHIHSDTQISFEFINISINLWMSRLGGFVMQQKMRLTKIKKHVGIP